MTVDPQHNINAQEPKPVMGTVLLVEDNMRVSEELSLVLESAGYSTKCAYDGEHMRAMLSTYTPHIVMLDLNLPSEDGITIPSG